MAAKLGILKAKDARRITAAEMKYRVHEKNSRIHLD
jgi:hypothetical protein